MVKKKKSKNNLKEANAKFWNDFFFRSLVSFIFFSEFLYGQWTYFLPSYVICWQFGVKEGLLQCEWLVLVEEMVEWAHIELTFWHINGWTEITWTLLTMWRRVLCELVGQLPRSSICFLWCPTFCTVYHIHALVL